MWIRSCTRALGLLVLVAAVATGAAEEPAALSPGGASSEDIMLLGARTFDDNCSTCHQSDGFGEAGLYPSLHDPALLADRAHLIRTILHGRARPAEGVNETPQALMPSLDYLSNREIVAVIAFVSGTWGGGKVVVTESEVQAVRGQSGDVR